MRWRPLPGMLTQRRGLRRPTVTMPRAAATMRGTDARARQQMRGRHRRESACARRMRAMHMRVTPHGAATASSQRGGMVAQPKLGMTSASCTAASGRRANTHHGAARRARTRRGAMSAHTAQAQRAVQSKAAMNSATAA